jgi:guanylate kinase
MTNSPGKLVVFSGPAGAGKSTVLRELFKQCRLPLEMSVSATTRSPRPGEQDGVDYHFLSPEEFERRRSEGDFLECFEVFGLGYWYGTLLSEVAPRLESGKWVVLEVDVDGTMAVVEHVPDAITIFIRPPSLEEVERRLRHRGTETEDVIKRRLEVARHEMELASRYQHQVTNDEVDRAVREIYDILNLSKHGE